MYGNAIVGAYVVLVLLLPAGVVAVHACRSRPVGGLVRGVLLGGLVGGAPGLALGLLALGSGPEPVSALALTAVLMLAGIFLGSTAGLAISGSRLDGLSSAERRYPVLVLLVAVLLTLVCRCTLNATSAAYHRGVLPDVERWLRADVVSSTAPIRWMPGRGPLIWGEAAGLRLSFASPATDPSPQTSLAVSRKHAPVSPVIIYVPVATGKPFGPAELIAAGLRPEVVQCLKPIRSRYPALIGGYRGVCYQTVVADASGGGTSSPQGGWRAVVSSRGPAHLSLYCTGRHASARR